MFKKIMKKIACTALAITSVVACAGTFTACETAHPEVKMVLQFNNKNYDLEYKLYRNIAPSTTNHFLWLVENGYYTDFCVHNYDATNQKMYTGGYKVSAAEADEDGLDYVAYYDKVKTYSAFPATVWLNENKTNPTYTVYGEFEDNGFKVENGDIDQTFGSLTMYYNKKDTTESIYTPYLQKDKENQVAPRKYSNNSATSLFYISLYEESIDNTAYCTFATLDEDSVETLKTFKSDLAAYISANYGQTEESDTKSSFTDARKVTVDKDDPFVGKKDTTLTFNVPKAPIVIKSITVTKY